MVFNFLATATTPAVASAVGSRNSTAAGEVVYQATALAVLLGLAVAAGLYTNASWLLSVMGADPSQGEHMHDLAMQYLLIRWVAAGAWFGRCEIPPVGCGCNAADACTCKHQRAWQQHRHTYLNTPAVCVQRVGGCSMFQSTRVHFAAVFRMRVLPA